MQKQELFWIDQVSPYVMDDCVQRLSGLIIIIIIVSGVGLLALRLLLAYCTSPG
jgi:hypothetical protein